MAVSRFSKTRTATLRARRLRRDMTAAEKVLWNSLRGRQVAGIAFRRQHPVGAYVADFCAPSIKLVIELDGGQHGRAPSMAVDDFRTNALNARGFHVLRFWNNEVIENLQGVVEDIFRVCGARKTTPP